MAGSNQGKGTQQDTPTFQRGMDLGTACGTAAARGTGGGGVAGAVGPFEVPPYRIATDHMAVAQKKNGIPKWVALASGNMDQHLRFATPA